jgi:hypothetical protein
MVAGDDRISTRPTRLELSLEKVKTPIGSNGLLGIEVPELAGGAPELANALILESKENSTVNEVGIRGPFEGSDVSEPPINVSVAGKPL